jgi:hypothetical protein
MGRRAATVGLLAAWSAVYFVATYLLSARKPLWFDELVMFHLARLPSLSDLWTALHNGVAFMPPLFILAARYALAVCGDDVIGVRLPAAAGVWLMSLTLFAFVARRCAPAYAWAALLYAPLTGAHQHAYEGCSYGSLLGWSGLALLCWQAAAEGWRRPLTLTGLALSLAAAVSTHYYAVLVFIPLGMAELVRTFTRRKVDLLLWGALVLGLAPLALLAPFIRVGMSYKYAFWSRATWGAIPRFYELLMMRTLPAVAAAMVLGVIVTWSRRTRVGSQDTAKRAALRLPAHDLAAALGFVCLPVFGVVMAMTVTGGFTYRYVLPATVGCTALLAFALAWLGRGRAAMGWIASAVFLGWFVFQTVMDSRAVHPEAVAQAEVDEYLRAQGTDGDLPVVVGDYVSYMGWAYNAPPALATRMLCVHDDAYYRRSLRTLPASVPLRLEDYETVLAAHGRFLVLQKNKPETNWLLLQDLEAKGRRVEVKARGRYVTLFLVTRD